MQVAWAPPEYGSVVATAAADGSLSVWEAAPGQHWKRTASLQCGRGSVTALEFAPTDHGPLLAAASSDGYARCEAAHFSRTDAWDTGHVTLCTFLRPWCPIDRAVDAYVCHSNHDQCCPLPCRLYRADGEGGALAWAEDNDFRACVGGACTALAWQQEPAGLHPLLASGSERGAEVRVSALHAPPCPTAALPACYGARTLCSHEQTSAFQSRLLLQHPLMQRRNACMQARSVQCAFPSRQAFAIVVFRRASLHAMTQPRIFAALRACSL